MMATMRLLLTGADKLEPLTDRDAWAATFAHVLDEPKARTDCLLHLPDSVPPQYSDMIVEHESDLNDLQQHIASVHSMLAGSDKGSHKLEHSHKQGQHSDVMGAYLQTHTTRTQ